MAPLFIEDLDAASHAEVRDLVLAGLAEHWGPVDASLNPDLDDMLASYRHGRTIVARTAERALVGTGTVVPRGDNVAEILRMSVHARARRTGVGRQILDELVVTAKRWGCTEVVLETSTAWTEVIDFYTRCGFTITHVTEGDFGSDTWFSLQLD